MGEAALQACLHKRFEGLRGKRAERMMAVPQRRERKTN